VTDATHRLKRRIRRDFPEPGSAKGVLRLLADLPQRAGYDEGILASERVQAAIILAAGGDMSRLRQMLDLATADWRDLLVAAGLADENWPQRLSIELGEPPEQAAARPYQVMEFSPAYSCYVDPELPGDGHWDCPVHAFDRDGGRASEPFRSRWGTPMIVRFTPTTGSTWIGMFEAGGAGGVDGVFACPHPLRAMVICDGQAYLIDVSEPERTTAISLSPITQASSAGKGLIVLASFANLAAIAPHGQAWASERLCLDNLEIVSANAEGIDCTGDFIDGTESFTVDAHRGTLIAGRRFLDTWPGQ
jgi:hypothetical protein